MFQSRNRESFDFKVVAANPTSTASIAFQSRNRESFDFKVVIAYLRVHSYIVSIS